MPRIKYGIKIAEEDADDLAIEMEMIRRGGKTKDSNGVEYGLGLIGHYEEMRKILWPWIDDHRWYKLCRDTILTNRVTVLMGCASSGKSMSPAWIYLCEYFCFPEETCVLVSSTDLRSLDLRVWAEIKMLFQQAKDKYEWLPGYIIESKRAICTDNINEKQFEKKKVRDLRRGIMGIPCIQSGKFVGLSKYVGIKQKRMRILGDELQFMGSSFLSAFANLSANQDFRATLCGNPADILDQLGKVSEPEDGWAAHLNPSKTSIWKTRFMNGICVNLIGTDSPNFDYPETEPTRYKYLNSREKIADNAKTYGKDSREYYSMSVGTMNVSVLDDRVLTRDMCRQYKALDDVVWLGDPLTKIFGLDAAYGGDRCVGGHIEFGKDINGNIVIHILPPQIVPIIILPGENYLPEKQIAKWIRDYCTQNHIPPENAFHDSTGRGSLGTALAQAWSDQCNPVEFGGAPSNRPVSLEMYILDPKTRQRRLKLCSEHYVKFVTELWFTVRYAVEAGQVRGLPEDVMDEFCMRKWKPWKDFKKVLETKEEMKERTSRSPDLADWCSICFEGARRRGFQISKLSNGDEESTSLDWLDDLRQQQIQARSKRRLNYAA